MGQRDKRQLLEQWNVEKRSAKKMCGSLIDVFGNRMHMKAAVHTSRHHVRDRQHRVEVVKQVPGCIVQLSLLVCI